MVKFYEDKTKTFNLNFRQKLLNINNICVIINKQFNAIESLG